MSELREIYKKYASRSGGGDKGNLHDYLGTYEKHMTKREDIDFVEIGVYRGDSLMMWNEYFSNSRVSGIDVRLDLITYPELTNAFLCDAREPDQVNTLFGNTKFDYVLDDGSHYWQHQIQSFDIFYPKLKQGGKYFIEDILSDENLKILIDHVSKVSNFYEVVDTRRPDTTFCDIILIIEKR
jgi:hypothetical protein